MSNVPTPAGWPELSVRIVRPPTRRQQFETYAKTKGMNLMRRRHGTYVSVRTETAWQVWLAATNETWRNAAELCKVAGTKAELGELFTIMAW